MLVLVVGPSGAGKDTLINGARTALAGEPDFVFPRRVVTRTAIAALEDHDTATPEEFALHERAGAYALSWEAHGLRYGLPASLTDDIVAGRVVVSNASRRMIPVALRRFPDTRIVVITASVEARAARLGERGRESGSEIAARLRREIPIAMDDAIVIDNSGTPAEGTERLVAVLRSLRH